MIYQHKCNDCFIKQIDNTLNLINLQDETKDLYRTELLALFETLPKDAPPPFIASTLQRCIKELTNCYDPYKEIKKHSNDNILKLENDFRKMIMFSDNPLKKAINLAVSGNIIDYGVTHEIDHEEINNAINSYTFKDFPYDTFYGRLLNSKKILYILDNTGEIVFDKLLIEQLLKVTEAEITVSTRGFPTLNDVTLSDAEYTGITKLVNVIDTGDDTPGVNLERSSHTFYKHFSSSDMIIAKGQGNFETLNDVKAPITFLFMAKCSVITELTGAKLYDLMFINNEE